MKKFVILEGIVALLAVSCSTVQISALPEGTSVTAQDGTVSTVPCNIRLLPFRSKTLTLSSPGYNSETCVVNRASGQTVNVVLKRQVDIETTPPDARILLGDTEQPSPTPARILIPADTKNTTITLKKQGYLTTSVTFDMASHDARISVILPQDGPGRTRQDVTFSPSGFPVITPVTDIRPDFLTPANDDAELVLHCDSTQFLHDLRTFTGEDALIAAIMDISDQKPYIRHRIRLHKLDPARKTLAPMTSGDYYEMHGTVCDDSLLFTSFKTGRFDLWKKCLDAAQPDTVPTLFLTSKFVQLNPDVSRDGKDILYTACMPSRPQDMKLFAFTPDSSGNAVPHIICDGSRGFWSPDAQSVVFQVPQIHRIALADRDGSNIRHLNDSHGNHQDIHPVWSPDGNIIAFASNRGNVPENFDIWIMDSKGNNPRKLTQSPGRDDLPVFSQDGKHLYFRSNRDLQWGVWKLSVKQP